MHLQDLMPEVPDPPPPPDEFHTYLARFMRGNYLGCAELGIALFENRHTLEVGQILLISLQRMHLLKEATLVADSLLNASADNPFIHALICLTLGTMPPDGALRLAGSQPDKCRVNFYAGARFNTLGLYDEARTYLSRCLQENINLLEHDLAKAEIHRSTDANLDVETLYAVQKVEEYMTAATYHYQKGQLNHKFGEAARVAAEAVACAKAHRLHPDSETSISALNILASCLAANGETGDAVPLAFEVMERSLRVFGEKDKRYIVSVSNLGGILRISKHFDESEKWYKKALTMLRDAVGENHRDFAICLDGLGGLYADMGKQEESWRLCLRATEILRRTCGEDNVEYAVGIGNQLRNISTQLHNGFESRFKDGFKPDDENPH
jgi:tetratricopeptide (TPR) repeat protein